MRKLARNAVDATPPSGKRTAWRTAALSVMGKSQNKSQILSLCMEFLAMEIHPWHAANVILNIVERLHP
jgi:hypothetical protein